VSAGNASERIWPSDDVVSARYPIFTRANTGEVFTDAATPFTWSLFGRVDYEGGYRDALIRIGVFGKDDFGPEAVGHDECVASFGGYVYINLSLSRVLGVRAPGMTTDAIDQSFFGTAPGIPPYRAHPKDENAERSAAMGAWMGSVLSAPDTAANERHRLEIDQLIAKRPALATLSNEQLLARTRQLAADLRPVFATHMVNLYQANIVAGLLAQCCQVAGRPELSAKIIAGFGDVDSAQQSFELWDLSRVVRASPELTAAFDQGAHGLLERLGDVAGAKKEAFFKGWNQFMVSWGFLGPSVWELRSPTYATEPSIVLHMLDGARKVPDNGSPRQKTSSYGAGRADAIGAVAAALANSELAGSFQAAANVATTVLQAREGSKVQCTRLVDEARITMRELGTRLVKRDQLDRWQDVLLMMDAEMPAFLADPASWAQTVAERKAKLIMLEGKRPPFIVDGAYPSLKDFVDIANDKIEPATTGEKLTGIGVSPGTHTGKVKVVQSIMDDVEIDPGDVLVARTTDSSWGALFLTAGAVVCETGAAISHAAIVARELGLPAAVSVSHCMSKLVTGMTVSVDGNSGVVKVLSGS
jgi:phosphohistidine swiveling domain-containing protein